MYTYQNKLFLGSINLSTNKYTSYNNTSYSSEGLYTIADNTERHKGTSSKDELFTTHSKLLNKNKKLRELNKDDNYLIIPGKKMNTLTELMQSIIAKLKILGFKQSNKFTFNNGDIYWFSNAKKWDIRIQSTSNDIEIFYDGFNNMGAIPANKNSIKRIISIMQKQKNE